MPCFRQGDRHQSGSVRIPYGPAGGQACFLYQFQYCILDKDVEYPVIYMLGVQKVAVPIHLQYVAGWVWNL